MVGTSSDDKYTSGGPSAVKCSVGAAPSLDIGHQKCTYLGCPSCNRMRRRKGRGFHRIMSGLRLGGNLKLITLTTSEESWSQGKDIQRSFRAFIMRLRRRSRCSGYVRVVEFTRAGRPHYHVIVRGRYIPQSILSAWWRQIHLSPIVDVRAIHQPLKAAAYMAKYLGKDPLSRYSWSWDWVWRGFARSWKELVSDGLSHGLNILDMIDLWNVVLDAYRDRALVHQ